jgi:phage terminase large subunit-like protein
VRRVSRSHGEEGIELKNGQRIRFRTRTKGGGRGFSGDCVILDEAMILPEMAHGALLPTLSARPNPQVWYTGTAVDQEIHEHGVVFARVRERGLKRRSALAYFDWSLDYENPDMVPSRARDPAAWAQANPGLGIRVSAESSRSSSGRCRRGRSRWSGSASATGRARTSSGSGRSTRRCGRRSIDEASRRATRSRSRST